MYLQMALTIISAGHLKDQLKTLKSLMWLESTATTVLMNKKALPLLNERERALLLSAVEAVDRVVIFNEADASS